MIRSYVDGDRDQVLDVWYRSSKVAHPFLSESFLDTERTRIAEQFLPNSDTIVYELDGRVVGFLSRVGKEVGGLFVDPAHHRRGIGRELMDEARRVQDVLELDVFEANSIGRSFYGGYGFEVVGRHMNEEVQQVELRLRIR